MRYVVILNDMLSMMLIYGEMNSHLRGDGVGFRHPNPHRSWTTVGVHCKKNPKFYRFLYSFFYILSM